MISCSPADRVSEKHSQFVKKHTATELSVAHYTGRIIYDTRAFTDINRDFVPPEMIETFRSSLDESIMLMFTNQLTKAGNLTMPFETVQHKDETERKSYVSLAGLFLWIIFIFRSVPLPRRLSTR